MRYSSLTMDDYEITIEGKVINKKWGREVKQRPNDKGYMRVCIAGKFRFVHRMVAEKYVPNPDNKPQVNHIDGNKLNNAADNLEWVTNMENRQHAIKHGLNNHGEKCSFAILDNEKVRFIRSHKNEYKQQELADMFGVSRETISGIQRHITWKHVE